MQLSNQGSVTPSHGHTVVRGVGDDIGGAPVSLSHGSLCSLIVVKQERECVTDIRERHETRDKDVSHDSSHDSSHGVLARNRVTYGFGRAGWANPSPGRASLLTLARARVSREGAT